MRTGCCFIPCTRPMPKFNPPERPWSILSLSVSLATALWEMEHLNNSVFVTRIHCVMFCIVNFSYPSLEEPKPPVVHPEPVVQPDTQKPPAPAVANGVAPAEPPTSKTSVIADKLPDTHDSPVRSPASTGLDLNKKSPAPNQSPATAKAFPQVLFLWS